MASEPYNVDYTPEAEADLRAYRAFDQKSIMEGIEAHLFHEPKKVSRSGIKQMTQPFWSQYRLRVGDFRVYYDVMTTKKPLRFSESSKKERE